MPKKFKRCVMKVKAKMKKGKKKVNPYAVCRKSTGYMGSTHDVRKKGRSKRS